MTSHVLTIIGDAKSQPIEPAQLERLQKHLAIKAGLTWLAESEACDLFFESTLAANQIVEQAASIFADHNIDITCTLAKNRRKKLLISDMDSTIIEQECIDELGAAYGIGDQIKKITTNAIEGKIGFADALRQRLALMRGMEYKLLEKIYNERITLTPGARTLIQTMRHNGAYCILVSGGFSFFTSRIAERVGFHSHQANELAFDEQQKLTGNVVEPVLGRSAKQRSMEKLCREKGLQTDDVLAVGDGANDIDMIRAAGLGVAFNAVEALKAPASACINHGDLTTLLYLQGYSKSQFVLT